MTKQFIDLYKEVGEQIKAKSASIFNVGRDDMAKNLENAKFPTRKTEEYLYCPLFDALKTDWGVNINRLTFGLKAEDMFRCAVPGIKAVVAPVINDVWAGAKEIDLGNGAFVCSMKHASEAHKDLVAKYYNTILNDKKMRSSCSTQCWCKTDFLFIYLVA